MEKNYSCIKLIKQIHDELEKQVNDVLSSQNLTFSQMHVLMELYEVKDHELTLKELEKLLHVAQSTVAGIVIRLQQKGYVNCFNDINDRRIKRVTITNVGMQCCLNAQNHIKAMDEQLLLGLDEEEKKVFFSLMQKICREKN